jgi:hypothetical protein
VVPLGGLPGPANGQERCRDRDGDGDEDGVIPPIKHHFITQQRSEVSEKIR